MCMCVCVCVCRWSVRLKKFATVPLLNQTTNLVHVYMVCVHVYVHVHVCVRLRLKQTANCLITSYSSLRPNSQIVHVLLYVLHVKLMNYMYMCTYFWAKNEMYMYTHVYTLYMYMYMYIDLCQDKKLCKSCTILDWLLQQFISHSVYICIYIHVHQQQFTIKI